MSVAHPWLEQEPWPTEQMSKEMLENRIERVLTMTNIGCLGTVSKSGAPIVSPVEFYNDGMQLYIFPQPNSPKLKAMQRDPRVSFAIMNSMAGWACVMGCQVFGKVTGSQSKKGYVNIQAIHQFTCDDGSGDFLVKLQVRGNQDGNNFHWNIVGGTGDYEDLHGSGKGVGLPICGPDCVFDVYTGGLHIDG